MSPPIAQQSKPSSAFSRLTRQIKFAAGQQLAGTPNTFLAPEKIDWFVFDILHSQIFFAPSNILRAPLP